VDTDSGEITLLVNHVIRAKILPANAWIFQNSSLTPEMVAQGKELKEVFFEIQVIFNHYAITAYNTEFVFGFLKKAGFQIEDTLECPMLVATPIVRIPSSYAEKDPDSAYYRAVIREKFGYYEDGDWDDIDYEDLDEDEWKWPSFKETWEHYFSRATFHEKHRAGHDVIKKAELILEMHESGDYSL
jgi:hypothetical protein